MQVLIGEIHPFPNARADEEQAAKILEEAAEVFCAWQEFDHAMSKAEMFDWKYGWGAKSERARKNLLDECADLIMACSNMRAGCGRDLDKLFNAQAHLAKVYLASPMALKKRLVRGILRSASLIDSATLFYVSAYREHGLNSEHVYCASDYVLKQTRECIFKTCGIISALGVEDFTPYMQECEKRNRDRGRYDDSRADNQEQA